MTTAHGEPLCYVMRDLGARGGALQGLIEHQRTNMRGDRCAKGSKIIAPLQH